jgi:peptidoglycan glycosyltransferase
MLLSVAALLLAILGRLPATTGTPLLHVNRADAEEIRTALKLSQPMADAFVQGRRAAGGFTTLSEAASLPILPRKRWQNAVKTLRDAEVDVQTADAPTLARTLSIPLEFAERIVQRRRSAVFRSPQQALGTPLLPKEARERLLQTGIVRSPGAWLAASILTAAGVIGVFLLVPWLLHRMRIRCDLLLLSSVTTLLALGTAVQTALHDPLRDALGGWHQFLGMLLAMTALCAGAMIPLRPSDAIGLRRLLPSRAGLKRRHYVCALGALLLFVGLTILGHGPEGVRLNIGPVQPVEMIKLLLVCFAAGFIADHPTLIAAMEHPASGDPAKGSSVSRRLAAMLPYWRDVGPLLVVFGLAVALFLVVRDMGPALVLFSATAAMLYITTGRKAVLAAAGLLVIGGMAAAYLLRIGVVPVRIDMWLHPWENSHPNGTQLAQGLWGIASGGIEGSGLGLGMPTIVPRSRDDLVFVAIAEELGLAGAVLVTLLLSIVTARGLRTAVRAQTEFDRALGVGISVLLGFQSLFQLGGSTGLLPLTGITLPFLSYGNSALFTTGLMAGVLLALSSHTKGVPCTQPSPLFRHLAGRASFLTAASLLGIVGVLRTGWCQSIAADDIAARTLSTPDADGTARPKTNPRLTLVEKRIARGRILDRNGRLLATSLATEMPQQLQGDPPKRWYPLAECAVHLIGTIDTSFGGPSGMEREFNTQLRGFENHAELLPYWRNRNLPAVLFPRPPSKGMDITLTIDSEMQRRASDLLRMRATPGKGAAFVAVQPSSGELLAAATWPSYNPNTLDNDMWETLTKDEAGAHALLDRARKGLYPPGSTLKVAIAAAALENGIDPLFSCAHTRSGIKWRYGAQTYFRRALRDDRNDPPHGRIGMEKAMEVSCNLYFAETALRLGAARLSAAFGELGLLRTPSEARLAEELPEIGFGQGRMLATPMEMARVAAAVANDGIAASASFAPSSTSTADGHRPRPVGERKRILSSGNAARIRRMMQRVTQSGTAEGVFSALPFEVAGKTGTAQTGRPGEPPHAWFIGFAPAQNPGIAFACVIENGGYGRKAAAPLVRQILSHTLR